ncbi:MAG: DUF2147 domain-containing protein [Leptonema sp. (in: Bacteria)]|nr:DUF2147 domain-containing protein [Leptonema sp. (in: bacteria)]
MMKPMLKKTTGVFAIAAVMLFATSLMAQSPVGVWKTIDDETGEAKSYVNIYESNGVLYGNIQKLLSPADQGKLCDKCPGASKNKPMEGLLIIWGLKKDGNEWTGGQIMDPKNGKVYSCKMHIEGNKLIVRGFLGFSLIGRSQTWHKL